VAIYPVEDFPFEWVGADAMTPGVLSSSTPRGALSPSTTRFVLLVGMLFFGVLIARLVFGYWRLRAMAPEEGAMILLDGNWLETRRERSRLEKWRVWGRKRAEEQAKAEAEAEATAAAKAARTGGKR
jgi:hypothetical protein